MRYITPTPSSTDRKICFLPEERFVITRDELHAHRSVPIHVPVARFYRAITGFAINTCHENAERITTEIFGGWHYGKDGKQVLLIVLKERTCHHMAGKFTFLKKTKAEHSRIAHGEMSVSRCLTMRPCWCWTVRGVAQRSVLRNLHIKADRAINSLTWHAHFGLLHTFFGEDTCGIRAARRWHSSYSPFGPAIGCSCIGSATHSSGIFLLSDNSPIGITDIQGCPFTLQLKANLRLCILTMMVEPECGKSFCRNHPHRLFKSPFLQVRCIVTDETTAQIDGWRSRVIEFNPPSIIKRRIHEHIHIGGLDLVYDNI